MAKHPHTDAWNSGAAEDIRDKAEESFPFVARTVKEITTRNLSRTFVIHLMTSNGYLVYHYDPTNTFLADGITVILDSADRPFVLQNSDLHSAIEYVIDGGDLLLITGFKGYLDVPFDCLIQSVRVYGDVVGSCTLDIWKAAFASFPPGPTVANSIVAGDPPKLVGQQASDDQILTGWTLQMLKDEILGFNLPFVSGLHKITISLKVLKVHS